MQGVQALGYWMTRLQAEGVWMCDNVHFQMLVLVQLEGESVQRTVKLGVWGFCWVVESWPAALWGVWVNLEATRCGLLW